MAWIAAALAAEGEKVLAYLPSGDEPCDALDDDGGWSFLPDSVSIHTDPLTGRFRRFAVQELETTRYLCSMGAYGHLDPRHRTTEMDRWAACQGGDAAASWDSIPLVVRRRDPVSGHFRYADVVLEDLGMAGAFGCTDRASLSHALRIYSIGAVPPPRKWHCHRSVHPAAGAAATTMTVSPLVHSIPVDMQHWQDVVEAVVGPPSVVETRPGLEAIEAVTILVKDYTGIRQRFQRAVTEAALPCRAASAEIVAANASIDAVLAHPTGDETSGATDDRSADDVLIRRDRIIASRRAARLLQREHVDRLSRELDHCQGAIDWLRLQTPHHDQGGKKKALVESIDAREKWTMDQIFQWCRRGIVATAHAEVLALQGKEDAARQQIHARRSGGAATLSVKNADVPQTALPDVTPELRYLLVGVAQSMQRRCQMFQDAVRDVLQNACRLAGDALALEPLARVLQDARRAAVDEEQACHDELTDRQAARNRRNRDRDWLLQGGRRPAGDASMTPSAIILLRMADAESDEQTARAAVTYDAARRMLDIAVIESARLHQHFAELNVSDIVRRAAGLRGWNGFILSGRKKEQYTINDDDDDGLSAEYTVRAKFGGQPCFLKTVDLDCVSLAQLERRVGAADQIPTRAPHPNLVLPLGVFIDGPTAYLHFDAPGFTGKSLWDVIPRGLFARPTGRWTPHELLRFFIECIDGLSALHERGIVHGGISRRSVWLSEGGGAALFDMSLPGDGDHDEDDAHDPWRGSSPSTPSPSSGAAPQRDGLQEDVAALGDTLELAVTMMSDSLATSALRGQLQSLAGGMADDVSAADVAIRPSLRAARAEVIRMQTEHAQWLQSEATAAFAAAATLERQAADLAGQVAAATCIIPPYWVGMGSPATRHPTQYFASIVEACLSATGSSRRVASVKRVENQVLWQKYRLECALIRANNERARTYPADTALVKPHLHPANQATGLVVKDTTAFEGINEEYLFHACSMASAESITDSGFDPRRSGEAAGTVFGHGTYFASDVRKSLTYYQGAMLVARVALGTPVVVKANSHGASTMRRPPARPCGSSARGVGSDADSVIGEKPSDPASEFIIYSTAQAYPEFLVVLS
mgnify:FL=1